MKYILLGVSLLLVGCASQPKEYSIEEFLHNYIQSQEVVEVEEL